MENVKLNPLIVYFESDFEQKHTGAGGTWLCLVESSVM